MKYEILIDEENTIEFEGRILHRIRALKNFGDVKTGDIGGYVESKWNLSQEGNCWIYDNAKCVDNSQMYGNSQMYDNSQMYGNSQMYDNSRMYDRSCMFDNSKMYDNSRMYDNTMMFDNSRMYDNSRMFNNSIMYEEGVLKKDYSLYGVINKPFKQIFQHQCKNRFLTAILTEENEILYSVGCQIGIIKEQFIDGIHNDCEIEGNGLIEYPHRQEYLDMIDIIENYFEKFM